MGDMLSQDEIDALLGGSSSSDTDTAGDLNESVSGGELTESSALTADAKDVLGEIGNISMGTAATTLFALLGQRVLITTPKVRVTTWDELASGYDRPCVGIRVDYTEGLMGSNVMILRQRDVKIITSLMMGGDGSDCEGEITELDLSAIAEAMNQMSGSSSTSMSSLINTRIDIATPVAFVLDFTEEDHLFENMGFDNRELVCIAFRMEIGTLIDSEIMQVLPMDFAMEMVNTVTHGFESPAPAPPPAKPAAAPPQQQQAPPPATQPPPPQQQQAPPPPEYQYQAPPPAYQPPPPPEYQYQYQAPPVQQPMYQQPVYQQPMYQPQPQINAQPAQFQTFDVAAVMQQEKNIEIIMDVPLEVTVELGRTSKKIKEILDFAPGSIVELDRLAGEPIDILVNGRFVARGEVVVIDENFAIRITDIINADQRI